MAVRRVALLRGINVGKAKRIAMADLRRVVESLGATDVATLLNSGNVVYSAAGGRTHADATRIAAAVAQELGVATDVTVLDREELEAALRANPLRTIASDPSRLLLLALADARRARALEPLLARRWKPEVLAIDGRVAWLWCARGIVDSPLWAAANRALGGTGTARNLATMNRIAERLAGGTAAPGRAPSPRTPRTRAAPGKGPP